MNEANRWIALDTETTGLLLPSSAPLNKQPKIIELAVIEIEAPSAGQEEPWIVEEKAWLINPGEPLTEEITKITGLTDDDLKGKPSFPEVLKDVIPWFLGKFGMFAHNLPFDLGMIVNELRRIGREHAFPYPPNQVCTVAAFNHLKGRRMKLVELHKEVLGEELAQTHRALDDTRALAKIVMKAGLVK